MTFPSNVDSMLNNSWFRYSRSLSSGTFSFPLPGVLCLLTVLWLLMPSAAFAQVFSSETISDSVFARMSGRSYGEGCTVPLSELRYLRVAHYDAEGNVCQGELVCNKAIAQKLLAIFKQLYQARYPIERVRLIDDYNGDDERSMSDNNTSCFNFRPIAGSSRLSNHSLGLAIDINPLYNPCVRRRSDGSSKVQPAAGRRYASRKGTWPYKLEKGDLCHRLFVSHGFTWGGSWRSVKDYQHFEYRP